MAKRVSKPVYCLKCAHCVEVREGQSVSCASPPIEKIPWSLATRANAECDDFEPKPAPDSPPASADREGTDVLDVLRMALSRFRFDGRLGGIDTCFLGDPRPDGPTPHVVAGCGAVPPDECPACSIERAISSEEARRARPAVQDQRDALLKKCATALEHLRATVASGAAPLTPEVGLANVKQACAHIALDPDAVLECLQAGATLRSAGVEPAPEAQEGKASR